MNEHKDQPNQNGWTPCCSGELRRIASALRKCRCLHLLRQVATTASVLVLCLLLGAFLAKSVFPQQSEFGGITCAKVKELAPLVIAGQLDPRLQAQVDQHLAHCEGCRELIAHLRDEQSRDSHTAEKHASTKQTLLIHPVSLEVAAFGR